MKFLFLLILLFPNILFAYETEHFKIDIPQGMDLINEENDIFRWSTDNNDNFPTLSIVVSENKGYNIDLFEPEDVLNYEAYIKEKINNELKEFSLNIEVFDGKLEVNNNMNSLVYKTKWNTKESFGYDTYQKVYNFTTKNYLISLTFESKNEEDLESEDFRDIIKSFNIKDEKIKADYSKSIIIIIILIIIGGLVGLTISVIKNKIRSRKNER